MLPAGRRQLMRRQRQPPLPSTQPQSSRERLVWQRRSSRAGALPHACMHASICVHARTPGNMPVGSCRTHAPCPCPGPCRLAGEGSEALPQEPAEAEQPPAASAGQEAAAPGAPASPLTEAGAAVALVPTPEVPAEQPKVQPAGNAAAAVEPQAGGSPAAAEAAPSALAGGGEPAGGERDAAGAEEPGAALPLPVFEDKGESAAG